MKLCAGGCAGLPDGREVESATTACPSCDTMPTMGITRIGIIAIVAGLGGAACGGAPFEASADGGLDGSAADATPESTALPDAPRADVLDAGMFADSTFDATPMPDALTIPEAGSDTTAPEAASDAMTDAGYLGPCLVANNVLFLDGDPGDYIHPGIATITMAAWTPTASPSTMADTVSVHLVPTDPSQGLWWDADFSSHHLGQPLMVQTYLNAQRLPFAQPGSPGLEVTGDGRGCNTLTGSFTVYDVQTANGQVISFTASFEQHCEGGSAALRGCVHVHQ
jgi:hypothetical protein